MKLDKESQKKKRSPAIFLVLVFALIVVIAFIANRRSAVVTEIRFPLNNGVASLSTCGNLLVAGSNDNRIYTWDWTNMSGKLREGAVESVQAALVTPDNIVSLKLTNPVRVVVSGFDDGRTSKEIIATLSSEAGFLGVNRDRSRIFLMLARGNTDKRAMKYDLFEIFIDSGQMQPIVTINSQNGQLGHISVSDDGRYIVAAGEKDGQGWMCVVDANEKQLKWQKELPDMKLIFKAVFSGDGGIIYARGSDSMLLVINANSGEVTNRLLPTEENKSAYRTQQTQTVAVSPDGSLVAATVFASVYVWDTKTLKKFYIGESGHKVISSMVFSPDSRLLATSDMRQGGKIQILRMPRH